MLIRIHVYEDAENENRIFPGVHPSRIMEKMESLIESAKKFGANYLLHTDSHLEMQCIRVLIKERKLHHKAIEVTFHKSDGTRQAILFDEDARTEDWPDGFMDHEFNLTCRLL
jgi:predicted ATPase